MSVSRRQFVLCAGAATIISARGFEAWAQAAPETSISDTFVPGDSQHLILDSNENPLGPGEHVIDAVLKAIGEDGAGAGRYVFAHQGTTRQAIADNLRLQSENILLGAGSTELLRLAVETYTAKDKPYVTADPSFAAGERYAELLNHPVRKVRLDENYRCDLEAMLDVVDDAGLVYICNPNNPTATIHSANDLRDFIESVVSRSPNTKILIDEAYGDYVVEESFQSMLDLVVDRPQVIVARTFSKAYGMAGLRVGYVAAHAETIEEMSGVRGMDMYTSYPSRAGAIAALRYPEHLEQERARNLEVRDFTQKFFATAGVESVPSQANFILFDVGRSGEEFQKSCLNQGVKIRAGYANYPTHARVSLGTMAEMRYATEVFASLL